jgi:signal transduction histidine kinase/ligand-binding sensor domain-containing protein
MENGLPQNKVTAVVQSRDGYLWLGTYNGLARFDGVRFKVFNDNKELRSSRVTSLCEAVDGTLWIGDESGQVTTYKDGKFEAWPFHSAWSGGKIYDIATDKSGDAWLLNEMGEVARVRDGLVLRPPAGDIRGVVHLARSPNGTIWISHNGCVSALEDGKVRPLDLGTPASSGYTSNYLQGIASSRDGGLWVASEGHLRKWKDGCWTRDCGEAPWGPERMITRFVEARNGTLFAGTADDGLYIFLPEKTQASAHFNHAVRFPSDWVISICEDQEGNMWSGTGAGLVMLRPSNIETIAPPDGWKNRAVLSVCAGEKGSLWIGTEGAGLYRLRDGEWSNFDFPQGLLNSYVWSVSEDSRGRLWAGTWGGGLFVQNGNSFNRAPGTENLSVPMPALLWLKDELWIGSGSGLLRYQNGIAKWTGQTGGQKSRDIRAIAADLQGAIWCGTAGNGLIRLQNDDVKQFTRTDGLSSDFVECLHFDGQGALWIGTFGGGLSRFKHGEFSAINRRQGLPDDIIGDIESDGRGYLWMSSYSGIIRVSEADLNLCADGKLAQLPCLTYGINDGLPTLQCSEGLQPAGCKTADGRLWFATAKGLVNVDPASVRTNALPPPVRIETLSIDDQELVLQNVHSPLKVPPGRHRLEFRYTGLSFAVPEKVHFKCRLANFDPDWTDTDTKRLDTYNYIPPGRYTFQVIACNDAGIWNLAGASFSFEVLPFFWQTAWFRGLAIAALIAASCGLAWFETLRHMRRKLERAERQRDIERERSRIAQDIHDDLGAQLTRITMMSESARTDLSDSAKVAAGLGRIYTTAHELTRSMDEIVWAVNPRHDTVESLVAYLEKFAQDWLATAGIRCRLDIPLQHPEWHLTAEMRHNLFLACKEALHNVVKHSGATEVYIRFAIHSGSLVLEIEDNGRGFDPAARTSASSGAQRQIPAGNGLENMAHRLAAIGGTYDLQSSSGKGAKVVFTVPFKALTQ